MSLNQEIFAVKLCELEREYVKLHSKIRVCGQQEEEKIREQLQKAVDEYKEHSLILQKNVEGSRSKAVTELANAQLEYSKRMEELLNKDLTKFFCTEKASAKQAQAEAATLYAEYAIDFAVESMQYALIAALTATDLQISTEKEKGAV